jgi:hypothetical protein
VRLTILLLAIAPTLPSAVQSGAVDPPFAAVMRRPQNFPERSVVGTLDTVGTVSIVVKTGSAKQTFVLDKGATIRQGSRVIKVSDLPAHKGERVKVRYHDDKGVHRAQWVVVASPAPASREKGG